MAYNIFGYPGPKGDSAYRVAVKNGFIGSEEDWLNSLKGSKGDAGPAGTVMVGSQQWSVSTKTGSDIQISTGVSTNTLYHGNFLTMAAMGGGGDWVTSTISGSGISIVTGASTNTIQYGNFLTTAQTPGNYLTTAALSNHTHSNLYQSTGAYLTTAMASNAGSNYIAIGNSTDYATSVLSTKFLTTAAVSNHTHSNLYVNTSVSANFLTTAMVSNAGSNFVGLGAYTTASTAGSDLKITVTSAGLNLAVPKWLTTGAASDHTHSNLYDPLGNSTAYQTATLASTFAQTSAVMLTGERGNYFYSSNNTFLPQANSTASVGLNTSSSSTSGVNLKFSVNSSGLTFSVPAWITTAAAGGGVALSASNSLYSSGTAVLSGSSNITVSYNASTIQLSVADAVPLGNSTQYATGTLATALLPLANSTQWATGTLSSALMPLSYSSGFQTATLSTVLMPLANSSAFQTGTLSSALMPLAYSSKWAGSSTGSQSTVGSDFALTHNTAGLNLGVPKYLTTAMISDNTSIFQYTSANTKFAGINTSSSSTSGVNLAMSINSSGATFSVPAWITTYAAQTQPPSVISLNGTSGSLSLSGASNITVSAINGSTITIYGPSNILNSLSVGGNTGTTGSSNITGGGFVIAGGSNITLSQSNNSISFHGATANGPASIYFADGNGLSWGSSSSGSSTTISASSYIGSGIGIAGSAASTVTRGAVQFVNSNNITFGLNASTMTASYSYPNAVTLSEWTPYDVTNVITNNSSIFGNSSIYFVPFDIPMPLYADRINFFNSIAYTTSANSTITWTASIQAGIYTRNPGANSSVLSSIWTKEIYVGGSCAATSNSYIHPSGTAAGPVVAYSTYNAADAGSSETAYGANSISGARAWQMPIQSSLTPGHYWLGYGIKTTHGTGTASWNYRISYHHFTGSQIAYVDWGQQSRATDYASANAPMAGFGSYRAQTAAMPTSVILNGSDIKFMTNIVVPCFNFSGYGTDASNL